MDTVAIVAFLLAVQVTVYKANVIVGVTIQSYSNPNGTCYVESSSDRKCCDGPQREQCMDGDTCDTYFDICVGRMLSNLGCKGAFFQTKPLNNTNSIANLTMMESKSNLWGPGMILFVFVRDDDSHGMPVIKEHEHIDTLIEELSFLPSATESGAPQHHIEWEGKTRLSLSVAVWCDSDYYGQYCDSFCKGISPMAVCESDGKISCQPSDALLIKFKKPTSKHQLPDIVFNANRFLQNEVCRGNTTGALYPTLDPKSNTFTFTAYCGDHQITPIEFESLLKLQNTAILDAYFSEGIQTGPAVISGGYGEHIVPNVYLGVELKALDNPTGTSYNGESTTGKRRCCDIPRTDNCAAADDLCDLQVSVCIGEFQNNVCIGAVTLSPTYANTNSISTCGTTVLDHTNNIANVSHPMIGGMRLTSNITSVSVMVRDSDLNGNSSDIIDILHGNITVVPGPNTTYATSIDVKISNIASVTLRLIFWCAPGHSGLLCHADNGTDTCESGWYGNECQFQLNACSPNPCKHRGRCNLQPNNGYICTCDPGYTGASCEQDVDECDLHICQNNATCQNTDGGFNCICTSLWTGLICSEDKVPPCDPNPCSNGKCEVDETVKENFRCHCELGWKGTYCNEKNRCEHGVPRIVNGIETCNCDMGFKGTTCSEDIDECISNPCQNGGFCRNGIGNFSCACVTGYEGKICQNNKGACEKVVCQNNGSCLNLDDGFLCMCSEDFTGNFCDTRINHCAKVKCENNGTCREGFHDFVCNCSQYWSGKTCDVDVNECVKSVCKNGGLCRNTEGSFNCDCPNGWTGKDCSSDIDECTGFFQLCKYGNCTNTPGGYECLCKEGYSGPHCPMKASSCINVTCSGHGSCLQMINGYACKCDEGFTGINCEKDIDECTLNVCGPNSNKCSNSVGSYNCTCNAGWQGKNCTEDMNECSSAVTIPCSGNGMCSNTPGSYRCSCFPGFSGNDCSVFLDICADLTCINNGTCVLKNSETKCSCNTGWTGIKCEDDVNECETTMPCLNSAICQNVDGSYYCRCLSGWTGKNCETDINECLSSVCKNDGVCKNVPGSYICACQVGWIGMSCEIQNEKSLKGELISLAFQRNISIEETQLTITYTYKFLFEYICRNTKLDFYWKSLKNNIIQFIAQCNGYSVSAEQISTAIRNISNETLSHIFPSEVIRVNEMTTVSSTYRTSTTTSLASGKFSTSSSKPSPIQPSYSTGTLSTTISGASSLSRQSSKKKSWINDHWPVVAGCSGAFVIIVVVLAIGLCRNRRLKYQRQQDSFANPSYAAEMTPYDE